MEELIKEVFALRRRDILLTNKLQGLSDDQLRSVLPTMVKNCSKLALHGLHFTEESWAALTSALGSENSLTELDLSYNNLQGLEVVKLSDELRSEHCKLETLRLIDCSCPRLASALSSVNSTLRELDLSKNKLTNEGVRLLCDGLKSRHCKLTKLGLAWCDITEEGRDVLIEAVNSNLSSQLRELNFSYRDPGQGEVNNLADPLMDRHCKLEILQDQEESDEEESGEECGGGYDFDSRIKMKVFKKNDGILKYKFTCPM